MKNLGCRFTAVDWDDDMPASCRLARTMDVLRHHWLMPISCHFQDCKALLVTSMTYVSGTITTVQTFNFNQKLPTCYRPVHSVLYPLFLLGSHYRVLLHSFTPGSKLTFSTNLSHLITPAFTDQWTRPNLLRSSVYFSSFFD